MALLISGTSALVQMPMDTMDIQSDPICSSVGCPKTKIKDKNDWPKDYPVPNLGMDPDIIGTFNSLAVAEEQKGHHWEFTFAKDPVNAAAKTHYNFDPKLDSDMIHSANHLAAAETKLNEKWDVFNVMIDNEESSDDDESDEDTSDNEEIEPKALFHKVTPFWETSDKKQALAQSDPISGSLGWPVNKHKAAAEGRIISYPNPDTMALDGDIIDS